METLLPETPPAVAPRSAGAAALAGALATLAATWPLAGAGWLVALPVAGLSAGAVTSAWARTYYSGNPSLAYALALVGLAALTTERAGEPIEAVADVLVATLAAAIGLVVCITACWWVDVKVNFPRAYPDPAARPAGKSVDRQVFLTRILPGTATLAVAAAAGLGLGGGAGLVLALAAGVPVACKTLGLPGSLWVGMGPLLGLAAVASWALAGVAATAEAWEPSMRLPGLWLPTMALATVMVVRKAWT